MSNQNEKFYLTENGFKEIEKEYENLQEIAGKSLREKTPEIFHSDETNPEYLTYQENNELLRSRLSDLKNILRLAEIIKPPPKSQQNVVSFGASVFVETKDSHIDKFQIVGTLEANPSLGKISNVSPVGKALIGHKVGDDVAIQSFSETVYKIKKITY